MQILTPIVKFDLAFSDRCLNSRFNPWMSKLSRWISRTGDGPLYAFIGVFAYFSNTQLGVSFVQVSLLAFLIELPTYWLIKNITRRRRPFDFSQSLASFIQPADQYSLPSGHAAGVALMATMIGAFYPTLVPIVLVWAVLVAASRVILGVHFLTDVLLGAILGFACAKLALTLILVM